jgi:hypothetical protein
MRSTSGARGTGCTSPPWTAITTRRPCPPRRRGTTIVATQLAGGEGAHQPLSLEPLEPLAPETRAALGIPAAPAVPATPALSFRGSVGESVTRAGAGGTFSFTANTPAAYEIVIARPGTGPDPEEPANRVLRGMRPAGGQTVPWDGRDNRGDIVPPGTGYVARATLRAGEIHLPRLGSAPLTLVDPPAGACPGAGPGVPATQAGPGVPATQAGPCSTVSTDDGEPRAFTPSPPPLPDGHGPSDTTTVAVMAPLLAPVPAGASVVPLPPTARDDRGATPYLIPLALPGPGVLDNDDGAGLAVTATGSAIGGSAAIAPDGAVTYVPAVGFTGVDPVSYTVTDRLGRTATATLTVRVAAAPN